jgi:4-amino-4-deoxy-L-arabinose transferase-like glycosyltransferase
MKKSAMARSNLLIKRFPEVSLFAFAFILRVFWAIWVERSVNILDPAEYLILAKTLALTGHYSWAGSLTAFRPVGFPFFLSLFYHFLPDPIVLIKFALAVLGSLTAVLIYRLSFREFGHRKASFAAATLFAAFPSSISISSVVWSETLFTFLLFLSFCLAQNRKSRIWILAAGVSLAAACYVRPVALLILPFLFFPDVLKRDIRGYATKTITTIAVVCVATVPWTYRNYTVFHEFCWMCTSMGMNTYAGHNPHADGMFRADSTLMAIDGSALSEVRKDKLLNKLGWDYVRLHPVNELYAFVRNIVRLTVNERDCFYLSFLRENNQTFSLKLRMLGLLNNLYYYGILVPFLLVPWWNKSKQYPVLAGLALSFWVQIVFYSAMVINGRYKYPALPFMFVAASYWYMNRFNGPGASKKRE